MFCIVIQQIGAREEKAAGQDGHGDGGGTTRLILCLMFS